MDYAKCTLVVDIGDKTRIVNLVTNIKKLNYILKSFFFISKVIIKNTSISYKLLCRHIYYEY